MAYTSPPHLSYYGYSSAHDFYQKRLFQRQHSRHASGDFGSYSSPRYSSTGYYSTGIEYTSPPGKVHRMRRHSTSTPTRPSTVPRPSSSSKKSPPPPKATEADARKHHIPPGYSLKNWDPTEEPIMLLGSVFDANSLGKWIYDWTVYHHGPATTISDIARELWLLLIQFADKVKRAEECIPCIQSEESREMVEGFIESGGRLTNKLNKLLNACETPMLKAAGKHGKGQTLGTDAGIEFVDSIFGRHRQLQNTEKFIASIRLWNLRFDANCTDILL
jgi:hypothetical protein